MNENLLKNEIISSFRDEDEKKFYLIQKWNDESSKAQYLKLTLTDLIDFWSESFSKENIQEFSAAFQKLSKIELNGIKDQFKRAFSNDMSNEKKYSIHLAENSLTRTKSFTLKQLHDRGVIIDIINLKLKYVKEPAKQLEEMLDFSIGRIKSLEDQVTTLQEDNKLLNNSKKDAEQMMQEMIKEKNELEYDMYSKFVLVLNEKKDRIRELTQENKTVD
jgi:DNA-repair protein XRCC4